MEKINCAYDELVDLEKIIPNPKNNNKHPKEQIERLAKIIDFQGQRSPIVISNRSGFVVKGHGRLEAIKLLGWKQAAVDYQDYESEAQEYADMTADNQIATWAEFDTQMVLDELPELDIDTDMLGMLEIPQIEAEESEVVEDEVPEEVETRCKRGDIWKLGNHRLMCGDSTIISDVEKLMNGQKADMVFTDPPYGMKKEADGVLNDNLNFNALLDFNKEWIPLTFSNLKEEGSWYCWGIDEPLMDIYSNILKPMARENKITFRNLLTWDKGHGQGQNSEDFRMYAVADEKCLFVMCGVQGFNTNADNYFEKWEPVRKYLDEEIGKIFDAGYSKYELNQYLGATEKGGMLGHYTSKSQFMLPTEEKYKRLQSFCIEHGVDAIKKEYDAIKKEYYSTRSYFNNTHDNMNNVWHFERTSQKERENTGGHATPKPLALCSRAIKSSSRENETVLDVFGGSGSTLIACEQLNRKCFMMELDEHYCDVIITRWENLTGKTAERITDENN